MQTNGFEEFINLMTNLDAEICLTLEFFRAFLCSRSFVSKRVQFWPIFFSFTQTIFHLFILLRWPFCEMVIRNVFSGFGEKTLLQLQWR